MTARSTFEDTPPLGRPAGVVQGDAVDERVALVGGVSLGRQSQAFTAVGSVISVTVTAGGSMLARESLCILRKSDRRS